MMYVLHVILTLLVNGETILTDVEKQAPYETKAACEADLPSEGVKIAKLVGTRFEVVNATPLCAPAKHGEPI